MAVAFPNVGKILAMQIVMKPSQNPKLRLYKSNVTPGAGTILTDLSGGNEASFPGYAPIALNMGSAPTINGSSQGQYQWLANAFICNALFGGETIIGWYITIEDLTSADQLFMAEKFPAGILVQNNGDQVQFDLTLLDELGA